jgi:hypothetical protein
MKNSIREIVRNEHVRKEKNETFYHGFDCLYNLFVSYNEYHCDIFHTALVIT